MSNKSLTSEGDTIHESNDAGETGANGRNQQEQPGLHLSGTGRLAHAMTAEEDNRMQSKPVATAESSSGDTQESDSELPATDGASDDEILLQETGCDDEHPVEEDSPDQPSSHDAPELDDSLSQPGQKDIDTAEEQQRHSDEETGADGQDQDDTARGNNVKHIVEAALLASGKPLSIDRLLTLFLDDEQPDRKAIRDVLESLQEEYEGRGIEVREVSTGWRIQVRKEYAPWVSRLWEEKPGRYSRALLETLSLIAYRQPITRGEIEDVRGVAVSTNIVKTLLERDWVRVVGHRDVPGRPSLYATTREFLDYFGLKSLDELPTLAEIKELDDLNPSLDLPEPGTKTDLQEEPEEDTHAAGETHGELPDDAVTESEQQTDSVSGETDDEGLPESQDERLH